MSTPALWHWLRDDVDWIATSAVVTAVAATVQALTSALLWYVSLSALKQGRQSSERQLRAYMNVQYIQLVSKSPNSPWDAQIVLTNTGQTPAYDMKIWVGIMLGKWPEDADNLPQPPDDLYSPPSVLGSGHNVPFRIRKNMSFSASEIAAVSNGSHAVFVYGCVNYKDCFDEPHYTRFRFEHGGSFGAPPGGEMTPSARGNLSN